MDDWRTVAQKVCTEKELETLQLRYLGLSLRTIALAQSCGLTTVVDRIRRAEQKIVLAKREGGRVTAHLLPKFRRRELDIQHAQMLARIALEVGERLPERTFRAKLPGDAWALRGIPLVGPRGVGGAIAGTRPDCP